MSQREDAAERMRFAGWLRSDIARSSTISPVERRQRKSLLEALEGVNVDGTDHTEAARLAPVMRTTPIGDAARRIGGYVGKAYDEYLMDMAEADDAASVNESARKIAHDSGMPVEDLLRLTGLDTDAFGSWLEGTDVDAKTANKIWRACRDAMTR